MNDDEFFEHIMPRDLQIWEGATPFPDHACSLIKYPFIYDPASKARLLGASNNRSQWEEFQNAFLEAITMGGALPYMLLRVSWRLAYPGSAHPHQSFPKDRHHAQPLVGVAERLLVRPSHGGRRPALHASQAELQSHPHSQKAESPPLAGLCLILPDLSVLHVV